MNLSPMIRARARREEMKQKIRELHEKGLYDTQIAWELETGKGTIRILREEMELPANKKVYPRSSTWQKSWGRIPDIDPEAIWARLAKDAFAR